MPCAAPSATRRCMPVLARYATSLPLRMVLGEPLRSYRRVFNMDKAQHFFSTMLAPLKQRNFCLLFIGQMISTIGDTFYAVALPWLMLAGGHSPQDLGIVLGAYGVPRVVTLLLGGWLSDRF